MGTAIAISPFSAPRQSPLISHGTLNSTSLGPGFRNLILVCRVATIGQVGLDLEIKYICNIWFKRKINSEKKKNPEIYISFSEFVNVCETWGEKTLLVLQTYLVHWHHFSLSFSLRMPYQNIKGGELNSPCLHVDGLGNCIRLEPHQA